MKRKERKLEDSTENKKKKKQYSTGEGVGGALA